MTAAALVGHWQRVAPHPACASGYAAGLDFQAGGLYFGTADPPGSFTWWDGGTWCVTAPGRLALSVANDAVVEYGYVLEGDTLVFTDAAGCSFRYLRVP